MTETELARIEERFADIPGSGAEDVRSVCREVRRCWAEMERRKRLTEPPALPPAEKSA